MGDDNNDDNDNDNDNDAMDIVDQEPPEPDSVEQDEDEDEAAPSSSQYVWSAFYDDEGTLYYYNSETQESAWKPPPNGQGFNPPPPPSDDEDEEEVEEEEVVDQQQTEHPSSSGSSDGEAADPAALPDDGDDDDAIVAKPTTAEDNAEVAKASAVEEEEGTATADDPTVEADASSAVAAAAAAADVDDDEDDTKLASVDKVEEKVETAAVAVATSNKWIRYQGDEGEYFYNTETRETQWEAPEEGFVDAQDDEGDEAAEEPGGTTAAVDPEDDNEQEQQQQQQQMEESKQEKDVDMKDNNPDTSSETGAAAAAEKEEPVAAVAPAPAADPSGASLSLSLSKWVRYSGDDEDYYYHTETQATQWEAPEEGFMEAEEYEASVAAAGGADAVDEEEEGVISEATAATAAGGEDGQELVAAASTRTAATSASSSNSWVRYKDDEGNDFYFNTETEATQWDRPDGFVESDGATTAAGEAAKDDEIAAAAANSANESGVPMKVDDAVPDENKAGPRDDGEKAKQLDASAEKPAAEENDKMDGASPKEDEEEEEEEIVAPEEEIDPAVKRLQDAEEALNKPDSIFEPSCFDNVTEVVSSQGGNPQKALTALLDNYQGQTAICGLLAQWLANLKSTTPNNSSLPLDSTLAGGMNPATSAAAAAAAGSSEAMAEEIRTTVQDVINRTATQRFSKEAGDSILNLSRQKAAFLEDMMESTRWRKLLIDLSASHKDSAVLKYCLGSIADRGHHREIAKRINQAEHFTVFRQMLQSELAAIGKLAVSAGTDPVTSIGMDELINDLKRACTATSYTYLYSLQVLRTLESRGRKKMHELEKECDDPSSIRLSRAVRKWEVFCQVLENSMVDPAAAMAGSSTIFHKRRLDVALTINELTQRQRKRQRPGDDEDMTDDGMNRRDDKSQSSLETALLRFLRRYALGVQVDDSLVDPLLPSGLDTVNAGKQIGALLIKHSLAIRALLSYLYKPGSTRVVAPVVKNKCARLIALAVRAAEEVTWTEYKAPKVKGGEDGELGDGDDTNSRELSDEVALTRVVLQGGQLCEQLESMVSFLVSVDKSRQDSNGSGMPPGPGQKLCTLAFQYGPVAQGVMIWAREFTHGNEFASSASFPTLSVSILSLARLVGINQPFARGDALVVALQFLKHTNRDVSYQKMNAIKEQSLRLLIHLLMQGEVAAVLNAITSRLQQPSSSELDASVIRYFVAGVLEAVRPPVSCSFVRLFAQLLLAPLCIDAVRSTYFQTEHRARLVQLVLAFPMVRTLNGKKLEGEDLAIVNSLMATYQIIPE